MFIHYYGFNYSHFLDRTGVSERDWLFEIKYSAYFECYETANMK